MPKKKTTIIIEELTPEELEAQQRGEPVTLADMPQMVPCVVTRLPDDPESLYRVRTRWADCAYSVDQRGYRRVLKGDSEDYIVHSRLDGQPLPTKTKPLPKTLLDDEEDGTVYECQDGYLSALHRGVVYNLLLVDKSLGVYPSAFPPNHFCPKSIAPYRLTVKTEGGDDE